MGTYDVVAQARCVDHPDIVSEWGVVLMATFKEHVVGLGEATGPTTGVVGEPIAFSTTGAEYNEGHALEYQFFYRRANTSDYTYGDWNPALEHAITWAASGTYYGM